jgi:hypothetical protein
MRIPKIVFIQDLILVLLTILWVYSGLVKLNNVSMFRDQLLQSPLLPSWSIRLIAVGLPLLEVAIAMLLVTRYRQLGLYLSFFLMISFTFYLVALVTYFDKLPCACGGILGNMGYTIHIAFNIFFTLLTVLAVYKQTNARRSTIIFQNP